MNTSTNLQGLRGIVVSLLVLLAPALPHSAQEGHRRQPLVASADVVTRREQDDAELVSRALMNPDDGVREEAVRRLPEMTKAMALPALQQALLDGRARVRSAAIDAMADIGGDAVVGMLAGALVDSVPEVREDAAYALGRVGGRLAKDALAMALGDPDASVRDTAHQVLRELARRTSPRPVSPRPRP